MVRQLAERRCGAQSGGGRAGGGAAELCCICCEALVGADLVLLSCSHVLHRRCSEAYERFTGGLSVGRVDEGAEAVEAAEGLLTSHEVAQQRKAVVVPLFVPAACLCPLCRTAYSKVRYSRNP